MKKHFVVFVPGLGDNYSFFKWAMKNWEKDRLTIYFHKVGWRQNKTFDKPLNELLKVIDVLSKKGYVSLIGSSAGGSAVINAFARRKTKVKKVINVCGRLRSGTNVFPTLSIASFGYPAFKESVLLCEQEQENLTKKDRKKIMTVRAFFDETVPASTTVLDGAINTKIASVHHLLSMTLALSLYKKPLIQFLKK